MYNRGKLIFLVIMEASPALCFTRPLEDRTGFSWDRVNVLHGSSYGSVFWVCAENSDDSSGMF